MGLSGFDGTLIYIRTPLELSNGVNIFEILVSKFGVPFSIEIPHTNSLTHTRIGSLGTTLGMLHGCV